jgi:acyl-[acyl-carrier-protein] desaturase
MPHPSGVIAELTPVVERLLNTHLERSKEWFPHEFVPWSRARDFEPDEVWDATREPLPDGVRSSLFVNLLTEDNLPYYFHTIEGMYGADEAWGTWSRRWTAEEGRHSIVMRDYLTVTRLLDPVALERARMQQVSGGQVPQPPSPLDGLAYVAMQELATRVAHRNTGQRLTDPVGVALMNRVAADENLHFLFYRDLVSAALEIDPSATVCAIERQVRTFEMPGTGIVDFGAHAAAIARSGIYDLQVHHDAVLTPTVLRQWRLAELEGLDDEAQLARDRVLRRIDRIGRAGRRVARRRDEQLEAALVA